MPTPTPLPPSPPLPDPIPDGPDRIRRFFQSERAFYITELTIIVLIIITGSLR
jgi:hypothetical protein